MDSFAAVILLIALLSLALFLRPHVAYWLWFRNTTPPPPPSDPEAPF